MADARQFVVKKKTDGTTLYLTLGLVGQRWTPDTNKALWMPRSVAIQEARGLGRGHWIEEVFDV